MPVILCQCAELCGIARGGFQVRHPTGRAEKVWRAGLLERKIQFNLFVSIGVRRGPNVASHVLCGVPEGFKRSPPINSGNIAVTAKDAERSMPPTGSDAMAAEVLAPDWIPS
jgi:hypothetical protein